MASCAEYFQGLLDYLSAPAADPSTYHRVSASIAGNRQENNSFVSYISVYSMRYTPPVIVGQIPVQPGILSGEGTEYFSDRLTTRDIPNVNVLQQPFDAAQSDVIVVALRLPNGPLLFGKQEDPGDTIAQFGTLQCTDAGLVVGTSDFDRSMILVSFREELGLIVEKNQ